MIKLLSTLGVCQKIGLSMLEYEEKKFLSHPVLASEIFLNWNSEQPPRGMELQEKEVQKD